MTRRTMRELIALFCPAGALIRAAEQNSLSKRRITEIHSNPLDDKT